MFEVIKKDKNSRARYGVLKTAHGLVETPAYVVVGTHAEVRTLKPEDLPGTKTQIIIANTYHLWRELGDNLYSFPGLHKRMNWPRPIMTDSGGFQVFSLGFGREHGVGKIASMFPGEYKRPPLIFKGGSQKPKTAIGHFAETRKNLVRVEKEGVYFKDGSREYFLGPALSIKIQEKLGADIILAFDECTSPFHDYNYTKESLMRTHAWAKICLETKSKNNQLLFGIIQGGAFEDLRKESAKFISNLPFDGFAIGGSLGKSRAEMFKVIEWSVAFLEENKPRHLLGIGRIDDIFEAVERGIDTFDCVVPTREARHGAIWTAQGRFDIKKGIYRNDRKKIEEGCYCEVCEGEKIRRKELYELFKVKDANAARFATIHNLYFFNNLMKQIRQSILSGGFANLKNKFLKKATVSRRIF
jgi:queuine tRNA-ribosyltransferase/7-cyano-7-deazaguanine tRNA-ribosyltransferase